MKQEWFSGESGLVEAWGSGIKRIFNAAGEYGLEEPRIQEFDNMFRIELFREKQPTEENIEKQNKKTAIKKRR